MVKFGRSWIKHVFIFLGQYVNILCTRRKEIFAGLLIPLSVKLSIIIYLMLNYTGCGCPITRARGLCV